MKYLVIALVLCYGLLHPVSINGQEQEPSNGEILAELMKLHDRVEHLEKRIERFRKEALSTLLWPIVDTVTEGLGSDQERCIAIAKWIASHTRNYSFFWERWPEEGYDVYYNFASRLTVCSERCYMFVEMCDRIGIRAKIFNIYNLRKVGGGHASVQAWYNGKWHFFDPHVAGYFLKDGDVLSFEEIQNNPEWTLKYLIPLERPRTRTSDPNDFQDTGRNFDLYPWQEVDIFSKMHAVYNPDTIPDTVGQCGFLRELPAIEIRGRIDAEKLDESPIILGQKDGSDKEMYMAGIDAGISEQLNYLGSFWDYQTNKFIFRNANKGAVYYILISPMELVQVTPETFWARVEGCELLNGGKYSGSGDWLLEVKAKSDTFSIHLLNNIDQLDRGMKVDQILIGKRKK